MKCSEKSMLLYAVTGGSSILPLKEQVRQAISGGITFLQLRGKDCSTEKLVEQAKELIPLCREASIPFVIDDDVQAALISGADGVHVGQSDMVLAEARRILGPDRIIGVSAHTVEEAAAAERGGADYIGVGAMFSTMTKTDAELVSFETLRAICDAVSIPVVAIGGISASNIQRFKDSGANGAAVVSAIFSSPDIICATAGLRELAEKIF